MDNIFSNSWHEYGNIYNLGHSAISELFYNHVIIEEKIDGSQFSFGLFDGVLKCRSKGQELNIDAPEKMFEKAVYTVKELSPILLNNHTYRAEYLQKPKHNVLAYDRVPNKHLIIFDINSGEECYMSYEQKKIEATRLGLECVPVLFVGKVSSSADIEGLLNTKSILGGQNIEGFVVKNYQRFGRDKKVLLGKFLSENFKEKHKKDWKENYLHHNDIILRLINSYRTPARWDKAIIHLREAGQIDSRPSDIRKIVEEVPKDLLKECAEEIKEELFKWAFGDLVRGVNRGLAEYYREQLIKSQLERVGDDTISFKSKLNTKEGEAA